MRVSHDEEADAAYIYLREVEPGGSQRQCVVDCEVNAEIVLDIDAAGRLIGIEILGARDGSPPELLEVAE